LLPCAPVASHSSKTYAKSGEREEEAERHGRADALERDGLTAIEALRFSSPFCSRLPVEPRAMAGQSRRLEDPQICLDVGIPDREVARQGERLAVSEHRDKAGESTDGTVMR
jgi:hypothetical protein